MPDILHLCCVVFLQAHKAEPMTGKKQHLNSDIFKGVSCFQNWVFFYLSQDL